MARTFESQEGMDLMQLLKIFGGAIQKIANFQCAEAVKLLDKLGRKQQKTGWVL